MFKGKPVIDIHGHMSTPPQFRAYAYNMVALRIPEDTWLMPTDLVESALGGHLKMLDERNIDVQMISPRPVAMMHWERPFMVDAWTRITNNTIHQQCELHPDRFLGVAQLPQHQSLDTSNCIDELRRCVNELGFVAAILNPDPGADGQTPGVNREYWFPLYEEAQRLGVALIVHPSLSRDPRLDGVPASYQYNNVAEEALAVLLYENGDVFDRYPELRIVVCHCGGALDRMLGDRGLKSGLQGGGSVGMAIGSVERAGPAEKDISANLGFDTCAYDPDFMATAIKQRGVDRMVFGTEVPGGGTSSLNPWTGKVADDLVPVIEAMEFLSDEDRLKILNGNVYRYFPLLKDKVAP
jgi:predicted TIM-barrel fold metal-dependent hydrolase